MSTTGLKLKPRRIDLTGRRFGQLLVESPAGVQPKRPTWTCLCDCGTRKEIRSKNLLDGHVRSCGCLRRGDGWNRRGNLKHGHAAGRKDNGKRAQTALYRTWSSMIQRCTNPKARNYKWYGARGITICARWMTFENFAEDMGPRPPGLSLDRIDNNLLADSYSKANCRWADQTTQVRNSRRPQRRRKAGA